MALSLTQAVQNNRREGETMTECIDRIRVDGETMTEMMTRVAIDTPDPVPVTLTFSNVTASGFKVSWTQQDEFHVENNQVDVIENGVGPIAGSPFIMAGTTLSKTVSGLNASTQYDVTITPLDTDELAIISGSDSVTTTA